MTEVDVEVGKEAVVGAPYPLRDIVDELSFVIGERRATIGRIKRERKETEKIKAIRIAVCEDMIGRTQAARTMVEAFPDLLEALRAAEDRLTWYEGAPELNDEVRESIRAAISKAEQRP